jgi:hypothetical protein
MGCAPDMPLQRLQALLGALYGRGVNFEADVRHLPSATQLELLTRGDLDVGVVHDTGAAEGVETERLYRGEPLAALVSLEHRIAGTETTRLEDLAGEVLIVVPRRAEPGLHTRVLALANHDVARFRRIREAPGADVRDLLFAVASGRGVAVAARSTLRVAGDLAEAVAARPLGPATWMPDTCLVSPANARPELSRLHASAREAARELYHG